MSDKYHEAVLLLAHLALSDKFMSQATADALALTKLNVSEIRALLYEELNVDTRLFVEDQYHDYIARSL